MSITENIVTGRKYRRITSTDPNVWERISFWTMAEDVELDDGTDLQTKLDEFETKAAGTANVAQVLNGYTFSSSYGVNLTGTMNNWGSNTITLTSSNTATGSAGYYSSISVNAAGLYSNAYSAGNTAGYNTGYTAGNSAGYSAAKVGNATAARVLNGYTFTNSSNVGVTGTMNNWGSNTVTMSSNTATLSAGYYSSISINAASRYTAGANSVSLSTGTAGTINNAGNYQVGNSAGYVSGVNSSMTLNCKSISGYANLTTSSFYISALNVKNVFNMGTTQSSGGYLSGAKTITPSLSYNASNGILTISGLYVYYSYNSSFFTYTWVCNATIKYHYLG